MKTKLEDFKDRSELFRWASEGKPIKYFSTIFYFSSSGYYFGTIGDMLYLDFNHFDLSKYKKVIEVETETINESMKLAAMLNSDNEILFYPCVVNNTKLIAKLKITATIEKCKETGEIVDQRFKLEEVESE
jgi:hypothetical protein